MDGAAPRASHAGGMAPFCFVKTGITAGDAFPITAEFNPMDHQTDGDAIFDWAVDWVICTSVLVLAAAFCCLGANSIVE